MPKILVTGAPGVGKSTVVREAICVVPECLAGFYTEEIREHDQRVGFAVQVLHGPRQVLARIDGPWSHRHGRYRVDVDVVDDLLVPLISRAAVEGQPLVIDEIAAMQMLSPHFCEAVMRAFDGWGFILATVHVAEHPFTDALKARKGVDLLTVTEANRDFLPEEIGRLLVASLPPL